jgi:uncharacterized membrane protein
MSRYFIIMLTVCLVCLGISWAANDAGYINLPSSFMAAPPIFFLVSSAIIHYFLMRSTQGRPQQFVNVFIALLSLKMFMHLIILVAVAFSFPHYAVHFIIVYALYYLAFTAAETGTLLKAFYKKK